MAEMVTNTNPEQTEMTSADIPEAEKGTTNHLTAPNPPSSETASGQEVLADEKGLAATDADAPVRQITGVRWILVVISILSSTFLFALDNTVVADVQPAIVETFGEIQKLPWLPIAFLVAAVSTNLIWGKVYGQLNAKWLYITTTTLFEVGSAICGGANTMNTLIVGRAIAGLGGAGMYVRRDEWLEPR